MTFLGGNTVITRKPACLPHEVLPGFEMSSSLYFFSSQVPIGATGNQNLTHLESLMQEYYWFFPLSLVAFRPQNLQRIHILQCVHSLNPSQLCTLLVIETVFCSEGHNQKQPCESRRQFFPSRVLVPSHLNLFSLILCHLHWESWSSTSVKWKKESVWDRLMVNLALYPELKESSTFASCRIMPYWPLGHNINLWTIFRVDAMEEFCIPKSLHP